MTGAADFSVVSRRKLLKYGLGAAGFFLMGGVGGLLGLRGRAPAVAGLRALTDHEYRTLQMLAQALFPAGGDVALAAGDVDLARDFDGFLADAPEWDAGDLKKALLLLEYGPVLFEGRLVTFSHLTEAERVRHFEGWATSDTLLRRQVARALRTFLALRFYDRPEAWQFVGYDGPLAGPR